MAEDNRTTKFRAWYDKNKLSLSEKRKAKYDSDPSYKKSVLERNKEYRARVKTETEPRDRRLSSVPKNMKVFISGRETVKQFARIGLLAKTLQRSVPTVRGWERNGSIPKTPFLVKNGNKVERLYTIEMIEAMREVIEARGGHVSVNDSRLVGDVLESWAKIGIDSKSRLSEANV